MLFSHQKQHYQMKENASLNVETITTFIQAATFAYYRNYTELPNFLNNYA